MKKITLTLIGASLLAGSLFAGQNNMMNMDKEECIAMHKTMHKSMHSESSSKNLTPSEKALNYIETTYGEQDDVRE